MSHRPSKFSLTSKADTVIEPTTNIPTPAIVIPSIEIHQSKPNNPAKIETRNNQPSIPSTISSNQAIRLTQNGLTLDAYIRKATMYHDNVLDPGRKSEFFAAFIAGLDDDNLKSTLPSKLRDIQLTRLADDGVSVVFNLDWKTFKKELKCVQEAALGQNRSSSTLPEQVVEDFKLGTDKAAQAQLPTNGTNRKPRSPWHPGKLKFGV